MRLQHTCCARKSGLKLTFHVVHTAGIRFLNYTLQSFLRHRSQPGFHHFHCYPADRRHQSLHPSCWGNGSSTLGGTVSGSITALWLVQALGVILTSQQTIPLAQGCDSTRTPGSISKDGQSPQLTDLYIRQHQCLRSFGSRYFLSTPIHSEW